MKCVLCDSEAEYYTYGDGPTPLCEKCAEIEARKIYDKYLKGDYYDFNTIYQRIFDESKFDYTFASKLNVKTREYE